MHGLDILSWRDVTWRVEFGPYSSGGYDWCGRWRYCRRHSSSSSSLSSHGVSRFCRSSAACRRWARGDWGSVEATVDDGGSDVGASGGGSKAGSDWLLDAIAVFTVVLEATVTTSVADDYATPTHTVSMHALQSVNQ